MKKPMPTKLERRLAIRLAAAENLCKVRLDAMVNMSKQLDVLELQLKDHASLGKKLSDCEAALKQSDEMLKATKACAAGLDASLKNLERRYRMAARVQEMDEETIAVLVELAKGHFPKAIEAMLGAARLKKAEFFDQMLNKE